MPDLSRATREMAQVLDRWESIGDRRAIFLGCYIRMTQNMIAALGRGEFVDSIWVSGLLHHFAAYYFGAMTAYEQEEAKTAEIWKLTFNAASEEDTSVISNLLLGVNAHINYDLVLALVDVLEREWAELSEDGRKNRFRDHDHVNRIIASTVDAVQDEVIERYSPSMDLLDKLMGPQDEWAASKLISSWRDDVWEKAVEMLEYGSREERAHMIVKLEQSALKKAKLFQF